MPHTALSVPGVAGPSLSALRNEIDRIDAALLELIEARMHCASAIADAKQADAHLRLRPARERQVVAGVAAQAASLPRPTIERIWRELMAASLQSQQATDIWLYASQQPVLVTDQARQRFGCAAPVRTAGSAEEALERARTSAAIAVIEIDPLSNWWISLFDDRTLRIFDALRDAHGHIFALAIGRIAEEEQTDGHNGFPIVSEATLRRRVEAGEAIRPLALSGYLRLCVSTGNAQ